MPTTVGAMSCAGVEKSSHPAASAAIASAPIAVPRLSHRSRKRCMAAQYSGSIRGAIGTGLAVVAAVAW
jgi:hypothetical protein